MVWWMAAAFAASAATSILGSRKQAKQAQAAEDWQNRSNAEAESKQIIKDRLATSVRNAYATAARASALAVQKQQLANGQANTRASALAATGTARANNAATGTEGASAQAVATDIQMKMQADIDQQNLNYSQAVDDTNQELETQLMNTRIGAPDGVRNYYSSGVGKSWKQGAWLGLANAAIGFGMQYMNAKASLGAGAADNTPKNLGSGLRASVNRAGGFSTNAGTGLKMGGGTGLRL